MKYNKANGTVNNVNMNDYRFRMLVVKRKMKRLISRIMSQVT